MPSLAIPKADRPLAATVSVPGSKSITNRALVAAALAHGRSILRNALAADDTQVMIEALRTLGFVILHDEPLRTVTIHGHGGNIPATDASLFCGNSGTTSRFLTAVCATGNGAFSIDGHRRMRERPMQALVDALVQLGARFEFQDQDGFLPLIVHATGLRGGTIQTDASESSQFLSALLLAAPLSRSDVFLECAGPLTSRPYIEMTLEVMRTFGVEVIEAPACDETGTAARADRWIVAAPQVYRPCEFPIEPDASSAAYFFAAAAAFGGRVTVSGLTRNSIQGDIGILDVLEKMGCTIVSDETGLTVERDARRSLRGIQVDLNAMPDTAPTLAVLAVLAEGPTCLTGLANLRLKESDRLGALAHELRGLGAEIEELNDGLKISPPSEITPKAINTYDDHRLAMSFAVLGLAVDGITINDPECVAKTYPDFFRDFLRLVGR